MSSPFTPVADKNRNHFMDVLRGMAIYGIFIVNFYGMMGNETGYVGLYDFFYPGLDKVVEFMEYFFVKGKFYSIFSVLFGWGLAQQLSRNIDEHGKMHVDGFIWRRLIIMLILASIHLFLLWMGDIIIFYALLSFVLLLFINYKPKIWP